MRHPAERSIQDALERKERHLFDGFLELCLDADRPGLSASVLRCLGRQPLPGTASWRADLVRSALTIQDPEIRDAAVQAAEHWGGQEMRRLLQEHEEPLPWLREYIRDVIEDLGE